MHAEPSLCYIYAVPTLISFCLLVIFGMAAIIGLLSGKPDAFNIFLGMGFYMLFISFGNSLANSDCGKIIAEKAAAEVKAQNKPLENPIVSFTKDGRTYVFNEATREFEEKKLEMQSHNMYEIKSPNQKVETTMKPGPTESQTMTGCKTFEDCNKRIHEPPDVGENANVVLDESKNTREGETVFTKKVRIQAGPFAADGTLTRRVYYEKGVKRIDENIDLSGSSTFHKQIEELLAGGASMEISDPGIESEKKLV